MQQTRTQDIWNRISLVLIEQTMESSFISWRNEEGSLQGQDSYFLLRWQSSTWASKGGNFSHPIFCPQRPWKGPSFLTVPLSFLQDKKHYGPENGHLIWQLHFPRDNRSASLLVPNGLGQAPFPHSLPWVWVTTFLQFLYITKPIPYPTHINPVRCRRHAPPKQPYSPTRLHSVTSQKTILWIRKFCLNSTIFWDKTSRSSARSMTLTHCHVPCVPVCRLYCLLF
jgi:hypothetical protein